ncbi:hornerin isoform X2 [Lingula anatina]|uniref:Hornerin isoform X2 n=1 Tax=Lingula anatina TaxID=7574 RepID=A0A1S3HQC6_LINAN|nr:hornerin isoform X2 [Lingula anatina]|eukprot:XP_013388258.1 hornerin isoform X2 [Lingula anatina]
MSEADSASNSSNPSPAEIKMADSGGSRTSPGESSPLEEENIKKEVMDRFVAADMQYRDAVASPSTSSVTTVYENILTPTTPASTQDPTEQHVQSPQPAGTQHMQTKQHHQRQRRSSNEFFGRNERIHNELLDEICSDMGIKDSMELDFADIEMDFIQDEFSFALGGDQMASSDIAPSTKQSNQGMGNIFGASSNQFSQSQSSSKGPFGTYGSTLRSACGQGQGHPNALSSCMQQQQQYSQQRQGIVPSNQNRGNQGGFPPPQYPVGTGAQSSPRPPSSCMGSSVKSEPFSPGKHSRSMDSIKTGVETQSDHGYSSCDLNSMSSRCSSAVTFSNHYGSMESLHTVSSRGHPGSSYSSGSSSCMENRSSCAHATAGSKSSLASQCSCESPTYHGSHQCRVHTPTRDQQMMPPPNLIPSQKAVPPPPYSATKMQPQQQNIPPMSPGGQVYNVMTSTPQSLSTSQFLDLPEKTSQPFVSGNPANQDPGYTGDVKPPGYAPQGGVYPGKHHHKMMPKSSRAEYTPYSTTPPPLAQPNSMYGQNGNGRRSSLSYDKMTFDGTLEFQIATGLAGKLGVPQGEQYPRGETQHPGMAGSTPYNIQQQKIKQNAKTVHWGAADTNTQQQSGYNMEQDMTGYQNRQNLACASNLNMASPAMQGQGHQMQAPYQQQQRHLNQVPPLIPAGQYNSNNSTVRAQGAGAVPPPPPSQGYQHHHGPQGTGGMPHQGYHTPQGYPASQNGSGAVPQGYPAAPQSVAGNPQGYQASQVNVPQGYLGSQNGVGTQQGYHAGPQAGAGTLQGYPGSQGSGNSIQGYPGSQNGGVPAHMQQGLSVTIPEQFQSASFMGYRDSQNNNMEDQFSSPSFTSYRDSHRQGPPPPQQQHQMMGPHDMAAQQFPNLPHSTPAQHGFMQRIVNDKSSAFRSHPLFPLLRDLIIADMNFDNPTFPYQLISSLPVEFDRLLQNYIQRTPPSGQYQSNNAVDSVLMDALRYAHSSLIEKIQKRKEEDERLKKSRPLTAIEEFCNKFDQSVRDTMGKDKDGNPVCLPLVDSTQHGLEAAAHSGHLKKEMTEGATSSGVSNSGTTVRKHPVLPKEAVNIMLEWLREHQHKPYPTDEEKDMLVRKTRLTINQINYWFVNARRRILPKWNQQQQQKAAAAAAQAAAQAGTQENKHGAPPSATAANFQAQQAQKSS